MYILVRTCETELKEGQAILQTSGICLLTQLGWCLRLACSQCCHKPMVAEPPLMAVSGLEACAHE